eukprot:77609-Pyramimonas_sp.AAC.1
MAARDAVLERERGRAEKAARQAQLRGGEPRSRGGVQRERDRAEKAARQAQLRGGEPPSRVNCISSRVN